MILRNVCYPDRMDGWFTVDELLAASGLSELVGGIKDTLLIFKMIVLASFKTGGDKDRHAKMLSKIRSRTRDQYEKEPLYRQREKTSFLTNQSLISTATTGRGRENDSDNLFITNKPSKTTATEKKEKTKTRGKPFEENKTVGKGFPKKQSAPSKTEPAGNPKQGQKELPLPPDFSVKPKSLNWRQARTTLKKQYGIKIDDSAEGSRIKLTFGDTTRILHIHKKAGSKVRGGANARYSIYALGCIPSTVGN